MYWNPEETEFVVFIDNGIRNIETLYADTVSMVHEFLSTHGGATVELLRLGREVQTSAGNISRADDVSLDQWDELYWTFNDWERAAIEHLAEEGYTLESNGDVTGIYETPDYGAPLDCWLRFDADETIDPEEYRAAVAAGEDVPSTAEANTFYDGDTYRVEYFNTAVGLVRTAYFSDYESATEFLARNGFEDFTA